MNSFERLVRFEADDGSILYGDVRDASLVANSKLVGAKLPVLDGSVDAGFSKTSRIAVVKRVSQLS